MASAASAAALGCPWGLDAWRRGPRGICRFVQPALHMGSCYLSRSVFEYIPSAAFGYHVCDMRCLEPPHWGPHAGRTLFSWPPDPRKSSSSEVWSPGAKPGSATYPSDLRWLCNRRGETRKPLGEEALCDAEMMCQGL